MKGLVNENKDLRRKIKILDLKQKKELDFLMDGIYKDFNRLELMEK